VTTEPTASTDPTDPGTTLAEEAPSVWRVDLFWRGLPRQIAAYLVEDGGDLAVVESGPASTLPALLGAVRALGRDPEEITHVLVTHVHLDHAGGAGALLAHAPRARVYAHPVGAPHLLDPTRLLASAAQIYGDQMDALWGRTVPVPADRLVVLDDNAEVRVGRRTFAALDTPGHARHHHAYHDPDAGLVFTGDVAGIRLGSVPYVSPPTPPPDVDVDAWQHSIRRLRALEPTRLLATHFGGFADAAWHLDDLSARLDALTAWAAAQVARGAGPDELARAMRRRGHAEITAATGSADVARAYEQAVPYPMMAAGLLRHLQLRARSGPET
jgi:glyoxylase-like metal-dependent hydrolase (beta-lactamase superfamily II)